jgi:hypothetical protein
MACIGSTTHATEQVLISIPSSVELSVAATRPEEEVASAQGFLCHKKLHEAAIKDVFHVAPKSSRKSSKWSSRPQQAHAYLLSLPKDTQASSHVTYIKMIQITLVDAAKHVEEGTSARADY